MDNQRLKVSIKKYDNARPERSKLFEFFPVYKSTILSIAFLALKLISGGTSTR